MKEKPYLGKISGDFGPHIHNNWSTEGADGQEDGDGGCGEGIFCQCLFCAAASPG